MELSRARARGSQSGRKKSRKNDKHHPVCISYTAVLEAKEELGRKRRREEKKRKEDSTYLSEEHHRDAIHDWTRNEEPFESY